MFNLEKIGKGHGVQHSHWSHSMANINLYSSALEHFSLALTFLLYSHFKFRDLENVGQSHDVQHSQWNHSMANINLHKSHNGNFCASSYRLRDINISNFRP